MAEPTNPVAPVTWTRIIDNPLIRSTPDFGNFMVDVLYRQVKTRN